MAHKSTEQRGEERVPAALRVEVGSTAGITRDVSPSGIFFEIDSSYVAGSPIRFSIDFDTPGGRLALTCRGDIVRVEPRDQSRVGVAVRILESTLRQADD